MDEPAGALGEHRSQSSGPTPPHTSDSIQLTPEEIDFGLTPNKKDVK